MSSAKLLRLLLVAALACSAGAATFGTVVQIGGHASDLALDERRGLLYAANFTANRIEVISTSDLTLGTPIPVEAQPGSITLSPDGRYLVIGHYAKWVGSSAIEPSITILDLDGGGRRNFPVAASPLAVAFGGGYQALVVAGDGFYLLNPATGALQLLEPKDMAGQDLPVPLATFPPQIVQASVGVSGDRRYVIGLAGTAEQDAGKTIHFRFNVETHEVRYGTITSAPPLGPRTVSVDRDGSASVLGWALWDSRTVLLAQFPNVKGDLNVGSHAFDWARSLIYAQIPAATETGVPAPELHVLDSDNLTVRERLQLPENLAGRSLLNSDHSMMYSVSDSGVLALPVGTFHWAPRIAASKEDVLFQGSFCDRRTMVQEVDILDAGGGPIDFKLTTSMAGVTMSPDSGSTPARVKIYVDPAVYQNLKGTTAGKIEITSRAGVNIPAPIRVLINTKEPEQRGALFNVPGKLVDILSDPFRNRFYVLRQDKNQVQVFDATSYQQLGTLRTGNTPTQMAITYDNRWLLVGNENSQIANRYDLDVLQAASPIVFPPGHYPRSIATSSNAVLAAVRSVTPGDGCPNGYGLHTIDRVDLDTLTASTLPSLGVYCNDISLGTVLISPPSKSTIIAASDDGNVFLYEAEADTFVASRKDNEALGGAFAALSDHAYVVDNHLLNRSLVTYGGFETGSGLSSGFTIHDGMGLRTTAPSISSPGVMQRLDLDRWSETIRLVKMIEAPLLVGSMATMPAGQIGQSILPFTRTLTVPANRNSFISLSVSGFVVLPWDFDIVEAKPVIQSVVNSADGTSAVAPGSLIAVYGESFGRVTVTNSELPVPTTLGEACLTVNSVNTPLMMVSYGQINAQMPFEVMGNATLVLRTSGGMSDPFQLSVAASAPAVFHTAAAGPDTGLAAVYRHVNNEPVTLSNPVHPKDYLVIYLTGLGRTSPAVDSGAPAPAEPLAQVTTPPGVSLGGTALDVFYAGLTPGLVGVYQINVYVPEGVAQGMEVPLVIERPGGDVTFSVRVVR